MATQLNIKDEATVRLARDLAKATGMSVTATIKAALQREMQERLAQRAEKIARINAIVAEFQQNLPPEWVGKTSKEIMDEIYDEDGLPI
jgi:antitoxin VapB